MPIPSIHEECGIVAMFSNNYSELLPTALLAATGVQHRGQNGAGVCLNTKTGLVSYKGKGLLKQIFTSKVINNLNQKSNWALVHCRYGTFGDYDDINLQPCMAETNNNVQVAVIHNGEFTDTVKVRYKLDSGLPDKISDTAIFTRFLADSRGKSWPIKITNALDEIKGAYSIVIAVAGKLFAARDPSGIRPLILGKTKEAWIVVSETHALDKIGGKIIRKINPGEVIKIDEKGIEIISKGNSGISHFCDFEWAYFSRPDSMWPASENKTSFPKDWLSFAAFRYRCGDVLAQEVVIPNASFVVGAPDSGIHIATGYANRAGLDYKPMIIRDHFDPNGEHRLFMADEQKDRIGSKILGKLSLVPDLSIWKDAIVVLADDSIIRSNVSRKITQAVFSLGVKEVHWVVGFPPVCFGCHLGVSMRTRTELIAAQFNGEAKKIANSISATSVHYISAKGFLEARLGWGKVKIPKQKKDIFLVNGGCGGCITGRYPIAKETVVSVTKPIRVGILISGSGTTMMAVLKACRGGELMGIIEPVVVVASSRDAGGIETVKAWGGIPVEVVEPKLEGEKFGNILLAIFEKYRVEAIAQLGWLPKTPPQVVRAYKNKIFNQHPAALDPGGKIDFGGQGMYGPRPICASIAYVWMTGKKLKLEATTHLVTDDLDQGNLLRTETIDIPTNGKLMKINDLRRHSQKLLEATDKLQRELLTIEHHNVIETLRNLAKL